MANKILVSLPEKFLEDVDHVAAEEHRSRSELIREALRAYLEVRKSKKVGEQSAAYKVKKPKAKARQSFPNIEAVKFTGGTSAVIRGTRIKVSHIVGYLQVGETPEVIANEIVPHITLPQVYEAIHYYFVHQAEIDKEREENTEEASRRLLLEKLGEKKYMEITGGNLSAEFAAWELASDEALENFEKGLKK
jgi:CopG family transcriptional regulator/antitoxin EndoAI